MKIRIFLFLPTLLATFLLSSCRQKEEASIPVELSLTARIEAFTATKTSYDSPSDLIKNIGTNIGTNFTGSSSFSTVKLVRNPVKGEFAWDEGDQIAIHFNDNTYTVATVTNIGGSVDDSSICDLNVSSTTSRYRDFYAVYPATVVDPSNYGSPTLKITLPAAYDISERVSAGSTEKYSPCPLVANNDEVNSSLLDFYHVGGLMRLIVDNIANRDADWIRVTFPNNDITGNYVVSDAGTNHPSIVTKSTTSDNFVEFKIAGGASVGAPSSRIFLNIPLPTGLYEGGFFIEYLGSDRTVLNKYHAKLEPFSLARATSIAVWLKFPAPLTPRAFSVSETKQVYFAWGNVVVDDTLNEDGTHTVNWRFADNQWDSYTNMPPTTPGQSSTYSHFGWGTGNDPWRMGRHNDFVNFIDWGVHFLNSGYGTSIFGPYSYWYTLSSTEWNYLLLNRPNWSSLLGWGTIIDRNGMATRGLIILPDEGVSGMKGTSFSPSVFAPGTNGFSSIVMNIYTPDGSHNGYWSEMERAGAVFLPETGWTDFSSGRFRGSYNLEDGLYWDSIAFDVDDQSLYTFAGFLKDIGVSVRLVHDFN